MNTAPKSVPFRSPSAKAKLPIVIVAAVFFGIVLQRTPRFIKAQLPQLFSDGLQAGESIDDGETTPTTTEEHNSKERPKATVEAKTHNENRAYKKERSTLHQVTHPIPALVNLRKRSSLGVKSQHRQDDYKKEASVNRPNGSLPGVQPSRIERLPPVARVPVPVNRMAPAAFQTFEHLPPPAAHGDIVLNFQGAPWDVVLERLAREAGLALQMEMLPPGTFTYRDSRGHTAAEALDLFNGYLYSSGFHLVRNQDLLTVIRIGPEIPLPSHLLPLVSPNELQNYGRNELLKIVVPLTTLDPRIAAQEAKGFLSPIGSVLPLADSNRIIVMDFGGNLRQLLEMLWQRDNDPTSLPQTVFQLKNIPAAEAAKAINEFFSSQNQTSLSMTSRASMIAGQPGGTNAAGASGPSVVVAEPTTNSLLVGGSSSQVDRIRSIIAELDCVPSQVLIQALLVEVDLGNTNELGVEVGVQDSILFDRSLIDNILTVTQTNSNPATGIATTNQSIISQSSDPGLNFNNRPLGNNSSADPARFGKQGLSNFGVGRVNGDLGHGGLVLSGASQSISFLLRALAAKRKIDILSRPQIRTMNCKEAQIQIGQQVPVVDGVSITAVGSANPIIRQDQAGIILTVLPRISPNDEIMITVKAEKSEYRRGPGSGIPIFTDATNGNVIEAPIKDISKVTTIVSCMAGQTIVLGGMITKSSNISERKVPILGDIPLLGLLFRHDVEQMQRKELLVFLTPYVVHTHSESDEQTFVEASRIHLPDADAAQIHGPNPSPPEPFQPRGIKFPEWPFFRRAKKAEPAIVPPPDATPDEVVPMEQTTPQGPILLPGPPLRDDVILRPVERIQPAP